MNKGLGVPISLLLAIFCFCCAVKSTIDKPRYEKLYRSAKALESATQIGVNYQEFSRLLRRFNIELSLAKSGNQPSGKEKEMLKLYEEGREVYVDSFVLWASLIKDSYFGADGILLDSWVKDIAAKYQIGSYPGRVNEGYTFICNDSAQRLWERARVIMEKASKQYEGCET